MLDNHYSPVVGPLGRHPLGGRNWEGFGVDPYLAGAAMDSSVRSIQRSGVQVCAKHYIGNEQETQRSDTLQNGLDTAAISSNIDDRTLHEAYLWPFADVVKAGVLSVMCSYNRLNETYSCENDRILNTILKGELGFRGYIVSDWFATHSGVASAEAGLDMTMPGPVDQASATVLSSTSYFGANLSAAVQNGSLSEARLDDMARRILTPYFYLGQDSAQYPSVDYTAYAVELVSYGVSPDLLTSVGIGIPTNLTARDVRGNHAKIIRQIGAAGAVLLKNANEILPLRQPMNIAIYGNDAADVADGLAYMGSDDTTPQFGFETGILSYGGGSGSGRPSYIVSPLEAIRNRANRYSGRVQYILDNNMLAAGDFRSIYPSPDVCLVFLKTWAMEGWDRVYFDNDWNSTAVVNNVAARCPSTIVVTNSAGVNTLPWATNENVSGILAAHYGGQEAGNSIADVLFGDVSPSGRLPYTIPKRKEDYDFPIVNITGSAASDASQWQSNFTEGLLIDYRHFDARNITPLYEFGFGLSYTTFELTSSLEVVRKSSVDAYPSSYGDVPPGGKAALWEEVAALRCSVKNTGKRRGAQVVQLYISFPDSAPPGTPPKVLRGFEKVELDTGETKTVTFSLARRDLSFWDVNTQEWQIPKGPFILRAGFSSRDLKEEVVLSLI